MTNQNPSLVNRYNSGSRATFIDSVRAHLAANPNAFGDLPRIVDADFTVLSDVTVGELFPQEGSTVQVAAPAKPKQPRKAKPRAKKQPPASPGPKPASSKASAPASGDDNGPDLRTEEGRQLYDDTVYSAIVELSTASTDIGDNGESWVKAMDLRAHLGAKAGKPTQLRSSFNRMIEAGKIQFTGKAAGTKYSTT